MDQPFSLRQITWLVSEAFSYLGSSPVVFMIEVADDTIIHAGAGRKDSVNPCAPAASRQIGRPLEISPFLCAALRQRCVCPFAVTSRREGREQIAHIPIIVIAACLLECVHILPCQQQLAFTLPPIKPVNSTCDILCNSDIGGMERGNRANEDSINIKKNSVKWLRKLQVRSLPERRCSHKSPFGHRYEQKSSCA